MKSPITIDLAKEGTDETQVVEATFEGNGSFRIRKVMTYQEFLKEYPNS